ncbi:MAG: caspase family protein, partial [Saprospiraceae bacterium]|nr:caspase family protein [Saprospiraceae bacterium]
VINLAFSPDNRFAYVACTDLTLHVFDVASGKEIAALVAIGNHDWAVTTPDGLFDASAGAMQALFYTVGREVIELEQLKERYYEPGLLSKVMGFSQEAMRMVNVLNEVPIYPELKAAISTDLKQLEVTITPRAGGIGKLSLFVNGKEVAEDLNPQRARKVNINMADYAKYYLESGSNIIGLRVYNSDNWLKGPNYELAYTPPPTARGTGTGGTEPTLGAKPSLYAVVVGTANYAGEKLDLKFADRDAIAFSQAVKAAGKKVFNDRVNVTLLHTDANDPSRQDISSKTAIQTAFATYAAKAKPQDVLVVYFSGHGVNYGAAEQSLFYYLTKDVASEDLKDPEIRKNYAISSLEITDWVKSIAALKQVMIIDACNSGKIVEDFAGTRKELNASQIRALDRMKDRTGMFILTGSAADKVSYEAGQYGQGLLTYSLLQGMSGMALTEDKRVDVMTLFQYSRDRVPVLAKGIGGVQTPVLAFPTSGASFDIGIVDKEVKIPLPAEKPVFVRNNFTDEATFDDGLGVTDAIENYLREVTIQGAQAPLIFVDVKEYEQAFSLKGRYTVQGDQVQLTGKLYKGKTAIADVKQTGNKNDLRELAAAILEQVSAKLK